MNFFRRNPAPAAPAAPVSRDGWVETRVERPPSADGWVETRVEQAAGADGWAETRVEDARRGDGWPETRVDAVRPGDGWAETRVDAARPGDGWAETRIDAVQPGNDAWTHPRAGGLPPPDGGFAETQALGAPATHLLASPEDYLAASHDDIGRLTSADVRELFVSCDAAEALQQQFDHLQPEFIALHDIGTASSRLLLQHIAAAHGRRVQKLVIRRQGYGTSLAAIPFVDVPTPQGKTLRVYSTDAETEAEKRPALARTLLGFSRLGVMMVGDLPAAEMTAACKALGEAMADAGWRNRQFLLLPLAAGAALASHGAALGQGTGVAVRTTPQVARPSEAWSFIAASWGRFGAPLSTHRPTQPAAPRPMPTVGSPVVMATDPAQELYERYLRQLGEIAGMVGACIFDVASTRVIAHAGAGPDASQLAAQGAQLLAAIGTASRSLGLGRMAPDAAITLGGHHLLLRGVPKHPGLALHVVLDKHIANLTLGRLQLQRMDTLFDHPG